MLKIVLVFSVIVAMLQISQAQFFTTPKPITINGTVVVDAVIETMRKEIKEKGLQNIKLPTIPFEVDNYSLSFENGSIKGLANVHRIGDVITNLYPTYTTFRFALDVINSSIDFDMRIHDKNLINYDHGHVHMGVDNVTIFTVLKFEYLTQTMTVDQFEVSVGNVDVNVIGLGESLENNSLLVNEIIKESKSYVLDIFNLAFKGLVNQGIKAAKAAIKAGISG